MGWTHFERPPDAGWTEPKKIANQSELGFDIFVMWGKSKQNYFKLKYAEWKEKTLKNAAILYEKWHASSFHRKRSYFRGCKEWDGRQNSTNRRVKTTATTTWWTGNLGFRDAVSQGGGQVASGMWQWWMKNRPRKKHGQPVVKIPGTIKILQCAASSPSPNTCTPVRL